MTWFAGVCSLPATALRSWGERGLVAPQMPPRIPTKSSGMVDMTDWAYRKPQPWEPSPHPHPPSLLSARLAILSLSPLPHYWPPKPFSTWTLLYHTGKPSCPEAPVMLHPFQEVFVLLRRSVCSYGPTASQLTPGGLTCPHPWDAQVSRHRRGTAHHLTPFSWFPQTECQVNEPSGL